MDARSRFYNDLVAAGAMPASPMPRPTQAEIDAYNGGRLTVQPSGIIQDTQPALSNVGNKRQRAPLSMPSNQIGMGEALIRIGGAGLGGALDGGNYLTPMAEKYGAIEDANRNASIEAYIAAVTGQQEQDKADALQKYRDAQIRIQEERNRITEAKNLAAANSKTNAKTDPSALMGSIVVNDAINRALPEIDNFSAGMGGTLLSQFPATDARDLMRLIDTMKANAGLDKRQAMRDASPTGGALGQVSEKELTFLQSVFGSLDQDQSPEQLRYNMQLFQFVYNSMIHGINEHPYAPPPGSEQTVNEMKALLGYEGSIASGGTPAAQSGNFQFSKEDEDLISRNL